MILMRFFSYEFPTPPIFQVLARVSHVMKVTNVLEGRGLSVKLVPMLLWRALLVIFVQMEITLSHKVSIFI